MGNGFHNYTNSELGAVYSDYRRAIEDGSAYSKENLKEFKEIQDEITRRGGHSSNKPATESDKTGDDYK